LTDHLKAVFHLAFGLVMVARGDHLELDLRVFQELLSEERGESTASVRQWRGGICE
jgi:hypothetical protein